MIRRLTLVWLLWSAVGFVALIGWVIYHALTFNTGPMDACTRAFLRPTVVVFLQRVSGGAQKAKLRLKRWTP